jgi:hypothetical protein
MRADKLTQAERLAIRSLERIARTWPKSLLLFASGTLTVRKPVPGKFYGEEYIVATIGGIPNDGGDGGREYCADDSQSDASVKS